MELTKRVTQYLGRKLLGGAINERGNKYEGYFTVFKITVNINLFPAKCDKVFFSAQEAAFVDDLLIDIDSLRQLYQLKTSKSLDWGLARLLKAINFDFSIQRQIEIYYKRKFELSLVVSYPTLANNLIASIPRHLKPCTKIIFFPYYDSFQKQILNDPIFRNELEKLSGLSSPSIDKLEALAASILGCWGATDKKRICLEEIYLKVQSFGYSFIKPRVVNKLSSKTIAILDKIPDFTYIENNGYFTWKYKSADSGIIPYQIGSIEFNKIELDIQAINPKDFTTLEKTIS